MNALFVGLGSIGQRHLRNIKILTRGKDVELIAYRETSHQLVIQDGNSSNFEDLSLHYGFAEYRDFHEALAKQPDIAFICNPSSKHISVATALAKQGCHLFIEKPLATQRDGLDELEQLVNLNNLISMVGFQSRFHPCIKEVRHLIYSRQYGQVISARFNWSNYLPAHHPYEDYQQGYAARQDLGGGVTFCLSHELDLIQHFFGMPRTVYAVGGHLSALEINVDDTVATLFRCGTTVRSFPVQLHLSFAQGKEQREFSILLEHAVIHCDLVNHELRVLTHNQETVIHRRFPDLERNELFLEEIRNFLDCVEHCRPTQIPLAEGKKSLIMSLAIHKSLKTENPEWIR